MNLEELEKFGKVAVRVDNGTSYRVKLTDGYAPHNVAEFVEAIKEEFIGKYDKVELCTTQGDLFELILVPKD